LTVCFGTAKTLLIDKSILCKYKMRITEITQTIKPMKPKPPMTMPQARINGLKQNVERERQQLAAERIRQQTQRETERKKKQQQTIAKSSS